MVRDMLVARHASRGPRCDHPGEERGYEETRPCTPDLADALALTFAYPVAAHDRRWQLTGKPRHQYQYDPFHQAWTGRL